MTHTTNYNLNKFEATDRVTRDGFNENADLIDAAIKSVSNAAGAAQSTATTAQSTADTALAAAAAGCRVVSGSYVGVGKYGSANPNTLTFDRAPLAVLIGGGTGICMIYGATSAPCITSINSGAGGVSVSWSGNSVSWYNGGSASYQANSDGATYRYIALFANE